MKWYVYILRCSDDSLYTGITTDTERRIEEHNNKESTTKYTRTRRPVSLVHCELCNDKSSALKRELEIKQLTRAEKETLIEN